jgi:hypothetical protein
MEAGLVNRDAGLPRCLSITPVKEPEEGGYAFDTAEMGVNDKMVMDKDLSLVSAVQEVKPAGVATSAVALERFQTDIFYLGHRYL